MDAIEPDRRYTPREAATLLDNEVTEATVKDYLRKGTLTGKKVGPRKEWRVLGAEILRLRKEWEIDG